MPAILPRRPISADLLPAFDSENMRSKYVLLLGRDPRLHVKTKSAQTSTLGCRWHIRSANYSMLPKKGGAGSWDVDCLFGRQEY